MRESPSITELRRHLIELGCPVKAVSPIVRETSEHLEDLQRAALKHGLSPDEAVKQAAEQLGEPITLAERHLISLRSRTFLGRRSPGFCLIAFPLSFWWFLNFAAPFFSVFFCILIVALVRGLPDPRHGEKVMAYFADLYPAINVVTNLFLVLGLFRCHRMMCNAALNVNWRPVVFGVMSFAALFSLRFVPFGLPAGGQYPFGHISIGWFSANFIPNLSGAIIPSLVGVLVYLRHRLVTMQAATGGQNA